jgi:hypothetical protein
MRKGLRKYTDSNNPQMAFLFFFLHRLFTESCTHSCRAPWDLCWNGVLKSFIHQCREPKK